jgi:hypothetical protein
MGGSTEAPASGEGGEIWAPEAQEGRMESVTGFRRLRRGRVDEDGGANARDDLVKA